MTTYFFVAASEKFLTVEEPLDEILKERMRNYKENNKEIDFWLLKNPSFLQTTQFADLNGQDQYKELQRIIESAHLANDLGIVVNAGHGLNYNNVKKIAAINNMNELNIGHSIVARALAVGLEKSVREMKSLITLN